MQELQKSSPGPSPRSAPCVNDGWASLSAWWMDLRCKKQKTSKCFRATYFYLHNYDFYNWCGKIVTTIMNLSVSKCWRWHLCHAGARPHPRSIPSPSLKLLLSLSENMQMCESRLQPTPVLALQSVLQDSGWGGRMKQDASLSRPLTRRSRQTCIAASSSLSAHWGTVLVTGVGGCVTIAPLSTLRSADSRVGIVGNGRQRGLLQGETDEIASVKRAGQMTEAWYLISEGYKLLITLPRCVIMMEDTVSLVLMDESASLLNVLNSAIKQNSITSDLSILEG